MTPDLVLFAIKSLIRLGQQGNRALIEYAVDQPAPFPALKTIQLTEPQDLLSEFLSLPRYAPLTEKEPFKAIWDAEFGGVVSHEIWVGLSSGERDAYIRAAMSAAHGDPEGLAILQGSVLDGAADATAKAATLVAQWKPDKQPVSPLGRMALAVVEVGLDYVARDPSILRAGTSGEKVLKAFAGALGRPIIERLDADTLGPRTHFARELLIVFAGAGLETLKSQSSDLISDEHLASLLSNVLDPLIETVQGADGDLSLQVNLQRMIDTLAGPAARAAMRAVAAHPEKFFGPDLATSQAAGALVSTLLLQAGKNRDVRGTFRPEGLLKLLSASLQLAVDRPSLFGPADGGVNALASNLATSLAAELKTHVDALAEGSGIDGPTLASGLAAAAIGVAGKHADALLVATGKPWPDLGRALARDVLASLAAALNDPKQGEALRRVFSTGKLVELGAAVVDAIGTTPALVEATDVVARETIAALAAAVSAVRAAGRDGVLSADDWVTLARDMVRAVAARPGLAGKADARFPHVADALATLIAGDKASLLSNAQVAEAARMLVAEAGGPPALRAAIQGETKTVAAAIVAAMAADEWLLLSGRDWLAVLGAALAEVSANPSRLFAPTFNGAGQALAADMLRMVLKGLPDPPSAGAGGLILKGEILRDAIIAIVGNVSGAPERAKRYRTLLERAVAEASSFVAAHSGDYGSREWLALVGVLTRRILAGKHDGLLAVPIAEVRFLPTPGDADALLRGDV